MDSFEKLDTADEYSLIGISSENIRSKPAIDWASFGMLALVSPK
jgi:hypothetical protein